MASILFDETAARINIGASIQMSDYTVPQIYDYESMFSSYDRYNGVKSKDMYLLCDPQNNINGLSTYILWPYVRDALVLLGQTPECARVRRLSSEVALDSEFIRYKSGELFALTVDFITKCSGLLRFGTTTIMFDSAAIYEILPKIAPSLVRNLTYVTAKTTSNEIALRKFNIIMHIFRNDINNISMEMYSYHHKSANSGRA